MKQIIALLLIFSFLFSFSQTAYWQQQADYQIEVTLNDTLHELNGFISVKYKNNSPDTLPFIYFHLWPNAYQNEATPFSRQQVENGNTKFWFSKASQKGYIDKLNFKVNAETCTVKLDSGSVEICKVFLNEPLTPGGTVNISTPFHVKLPETFSRLGHVGQSYQITQWYPKPAVYDKHGWHPMPYLDQGEFYSEFGSFDVSITVPENYVVGATGDLQNADEAKWLDSLAAATAKIETFSASLQFPVSSARSKTLRYIQNNIHDFAWFADKRFHVLKGEVGLPHSKQKVTTWALFTNRQANLWRKAPEYLHDAIYYYSLWIGDYPYQQVTAVDGALSAGGGMEYPNITVIGEEKSAFDLDQVITHEVGHNWFYGILGSNERDHAWLDEGVNSFYENRYTQTKYPQRKMLGKFPESIAKTFDLWQYNHKYMMDLGYQFMARENRDEPLEQTSSLFTKYNYGISVYGKTMLIFDYLAAYLGTAQMDSVMKKYFETWKYKHPQPEDLRVIFENETGRNLNWLFDDLVNTTKKIDYQIQRPTAEKDSIIIKNTGDITAPVSVAVMRNDSILRTVWVEGFAGTKKIAVNTEAGDRFQIDPLLQIPEINRKNNTYKLNKMAHRFEKLRFQFLGSIENQNRTQVFFAPYIGWNNYDKFQIGLALYNTILPARKFNYLLVPIFGTGSKQFNCFGRLSYNFYPEQLQHITVGVSAKRFSYLLFPQPLLFSKVEPYLHFEFKNKKFRSPYTHTLNMRSVIAWLDWIRFDTKQKETQRYFVNEVKYRVERNSTLHPFNIQVTLREGNRFANLAAEANFLISYKRPGEGLFIRVFAGGFLVNSKLPSDITAPLPRFYLSNSTTNNFAYWLQKDYMFDENFLDRNGRDPYLGRQVAKTDGAFRSFTSFGATNKFLMSLNLTTSTHRFFPINPFVNAAFIVSDLNQPQLAAEFGLSAIILRDMVEIHLPLVTTKNISNNQKVLGITKWYQKFSFTLKFKLQKPIDYIRRFF